MSVEDHQPQPKRLTVRLVIDAHNPDDLTRQLQRAADTIPAWLTTAQLTPGHRTIIAGPPAFELTVRPEGEYVAHQPAPNTTHDRWGMGAMLNRRRSMNATEFSAMLGVELLPWQTRILDAALSGEPLVLTPRRRQDIDTDDILWRTAVAMQVYAAYEIPEHIRQADMRTWLTNQLTERETTPD